MTAAETMRGCIAAALLLAAAACPAPGARAAGPGTTCGTTAPLPVDATGSAPERHLPNPLALPQPPADAGEALLLVEIPAGGGTKFETRADGLVEVDRFLQMPVAYPANYGALPSTLAGDGDPLDALVLTREPLPPGVLLRFRPVAVLRMFDGGDADHKLVGVPADSVDPAYSDVRDLADLPAADRERIEAFFRVYKQLPAADAGRVVLEGWDDADAARAMLEDARTRLQAAAFTRGPSSSARFTIDTTRSSSSSPIWKRGVKRSEFSPPWITPRPCSRSHSSVDPAP